MKALILSNSDPDNQGGNRPKKYQELIRSLAKGGIEGRHCFVGDSQTLALHISMYKPDIVFSGAYFTEEVETDKRQNVHNLLEFLSMPYIGSGSSSLELVLSKAALKDRWRQMDIPTPDYYVVSRDWQGTISGIEMLDSATDYPYIIKPSKGGNSRDITGDSVVHSHQEMAGRIETLIQKYDEVLVESFIGKYSDIREFTVSMIGHGQQMIVAPAEVILKVPKKERLVTTKDKENHLTSAVPITDLLLKKDVSDLASKMFLSADVRDYSRCDILLGGGKLYAIEINGQPMVPDKWFENCLAGAGLDTDQYLNAIFLAGLARNINQGYPALRIPSEMKNLFTSEIYLQLTGQSVL